MKFTPDQFNIANNLKFVISFLTYGKCYTKSYVTGVEDVLSEISTYKQDSVTRESLFKMFVSEGRSKHWILYTDDLYDTASSFEIIIEVEDNQ